MQFFHFFITFFLLVLPATPQPNFDHQSPTPSPPEPALSHHSYTPVSIGFPGRWDGDRLKNVPCNASGMPPWLNGYYLIQLSASYGPVGEPGTNLIHLFDGLGAVALFKIAAGHVTFSAAYYPTRGYKIWDFYERDMRRSRVAWPTSISPYDVNATKEWSSISPEMYIPYNPNIDFWRVGKSVVAGTEVPQVGYTFNVEKLDNFRLFPFEDEEDILQNNTLRAMGLVIHGRRDPKNDVIWSVIPAYEPKTGYTYSILFTVDPQGRRKVISRYTWGRLDLSYCDGVTGRYLGNTRALPGYMHSITSTERYIILPSSSALLNPCPEPRQQPGKVQIPTDNILHIDSQMPIRFLIYDKKLGEFLPILEGPMSRWPSHQLNAYENPQNPKQVFADMFVYENMAPYNQYLMLSYLQRNPYPQATRTLRYVLDLESQVVYENNLLPAEYVSMDYPEINPQYSDQPYTWAYAVRHPYTQGGSIVKLNVNEPTGRLNLEFQPEDKEALSQPVFIPNPGESKEDAGILLFRGINLKRGKTIIHCIDASTMQEVGQIESPTQLPFGFHSRFYSFESLGVEQPSADAVQPEQLKIRPNRDTTTETLSTTTVKGTVWYKAPTTLPPTELPQSDPPTTPDTTPTTTPAEIIRHFSKETTTTTTNPPGAPEVGKLPKPTLGSFRAAFAPTSLSHPARVIPAQVLTRAMRNGEKRAAEANERSNTIVIRPIPGGSKVRIDPIRPQRTARQSRPRNWYNNVELSGLELANATTEDPKPPVTRTPRPIPSKAVVIKPDRNYNHRDSVGSWPSRIHTQFPPPRLGRVTTTTVAPFWRLFNDQWSTSERVKPTPQEPGIPGGSNLGPNPGNIIPQGVMDRFSVMNQTLVSGLAKVNSTEVVDGLCDVLSPVFTFLNIKSQLCGKKNN